MNRIVQIIQITQLIGITEIPQIIGILEGRLGGVNRIVEIIRIIWWYVKPFASAAGSHCLDGSKGPHNWGK